MCTKSQFSTKNKTLLVIGVLLLSALFLLQVSSSQAKNQPATEDQLAFPLKYKGEGISTEAQLDHYLTGDTVCTSTATWEITLSSNGTLFGSYINTNPKSASGGECVSVYDEDHPSEGVNQITFSGTHSDGYFEITKSNLYYDYTHTQFRGHDKNIQGYYDADHIYTSPAYRYESNTYSNWTDMFGHEFDLPLVSGGTNEEDSAAAPVVGEGSEEDPATGEESERDPVIGDNSGGIDPLIPVIGIGAASVVGAAAAAGATAVVVSRSTNGRVKKKGDKKDDQQDKRKKDPCLEELNRLKEASLQARSLFDGIQTLRSYLATLDTMHENVLEAGYASAAVDLGFLGASIFTGPLTLAVTGKALVQKTFAEEMAKAAARSLGSELLKNVSSAMVEQGFSWEKLAKAPYKGAEDFILQNLISEALTNRFQKSLIEQGIVNKAPVVGYAKDVAGPIASYLANWINLVKLGSSVNTTAKKLEVIRNEISEIRKALLDMEMRYDDLLSEMRISRSVYNKCRQSWPL
jgi:hypothetical protein